jgi:hypothetical protein
LLTERFAGAARRRNAEPGGCGRHAEKISVE